MEDSKKYLYASRRLSFSSFEIFCSDEISAGFSWEGLGTGYEQPENIPTKRRRIIIRCESF
jgi:hypothetical protein